MYEELAPAPGSSSEQVTSLPGTSFLHVNVAWVAFIGLKNGAEWRHLTYNFKDLNWTLIEHARHKLGTVPATIAGMPDQSAFKTPDSALAAGSKSVEHDLNNWYNPLHNVFKT